MASDCRCASDRKAGERTSGTQIWIGRRPCSRSRARCSRTFTREGLGWDAEAMTKFQKWLHVTYHRLAVLTSPTSPLPGGFPPLSGCSRLGRVRLALGSLAPLRKFFKAQERPARRKPKICKGRPACPRALKKSRNAGKGGDRDDRCDRADDLLAQQSMNLAGGEGERRLFDAIRLLVGRGQKQENLQSNCRIQFSFSIGAVLPPGDDSNVSNR